MSKFIVCLALAQLLLYGVTEAKLRSRQAETGVEAHSAHHREYQSLGAFSAPSEMKDAEDYLHDLLHKLSDQLKASQTSASGMAVSNKQSVLEAPNLSFSDTLVLRRWTNSAECTGTGDAKRCHIDIVASFPDFCVFSLQL